MRRHLLLLAVVDAALLLSACAAEEDDPAPSAVAPPPAVTTPTERVHPGLTLHPELAGETLTGLSRRVTLALALVALAVALSVAVLAPGRTIFWYVIFGWSGIAATFCPVIVLSLVWRRYNAQGALASMITGLVAVPVFKFLLPLVPGWGQLVARAEELAPAFLVALAAGVIGTLVSSRRATNATGPV